MPRAARRARLGRIPSESRLVPALACHDLSCRYGARTVLHRCALALAPGRVLGLLGPNGSGKTTLFRSVLGLKAPSEGRAEIYGSPAGSLAARRRTGALVEAPALYRHLSGRDNLRITARLRGLDAATADAALAEAGLEGAGEGPVGTWSQGMRQRLGVVLAGLGDPGLLVLDEPANGLDPEGLRWLRDWIRGRAAGQGAAVAVASHLLGEVRVLADDILVLREGRTRFAGTLEAFLEEGTGPALLLKVGDPLQAARILAPRTTVLEADGRLRVPAAPGEAPDVVRALAAGGADVYEVAVREPDPEARYFRLVED